MMKCPLLLPTTIVADDARLAAHLSCVLSRAGAYLPVIDGPRMTRPDRVAEVVRRCNAIARARATNVILAGISPEPAAVLVARLSKIAVLKVGSTVEANLAATDQRTLDNPPIIWGRDRLGVGLLTALRARTTIAFADISSPIEDVPSKSGHLVVCEAGEQLSEVVAANYAFSLGAGLSIIPAPAVQWSNELLERLYSLNDSRETSPTDQLLRLREELRAACGPLSVPQHGSITFITRNLPYGFAFPELPSTHLFAYPDLGISVINGFSSEQPKSRGSNIAVLVDPATTDAPEIDAAIDMLPKRNVFVRAYRGPAASVQSISQMVRLFPYDLLIFATHCGDADGYRWTYHYRDTEGIDRTLVVDIAVEFGDVRKNDRVKVTQFLRFHSLDGVLWDDPTKAEKIYIGKAIVSFLDKIKGPDELKPIGKATIPRVTGSAALKMFDRNYLALPQSVADKGTPIIINNACVSWHELAGRFMFANARGYVGTLFPISTIEAQDVVVRLLDKYFGKPLAHAIWSSQNAVYGNSVRRPYTVTGVYPQRLRSTAEDVPFRILRKLTQALTYWRKSLAAEGGASDREQGENLAEIVEYYEQEVTALRARYFDK